MLAPVVALVLGLPACSHVSISERAATPAPWAHESSDLRPDPAVTWGRLENGLRYAVLPHGTPRQRASVFLLVQVGSFHERNSERGYAHFVEHMAFRELRDFPGQAAFEMLARLGAGPHVNAETGMFETSYHFHNVPTADPEALPTALKLMRAMADGIVFQPAGVVRERGVIFGEERSRDAMLAVQALPDELEFVAPREAPPRWPELSTIFQGTRIAERHPLGTPKTLNAATADKLRTFYERWYRPERMVLVVAGEIDGADVEQRIRAMFSTLAARGRAPAEPVLPPPKNPLRVRLISSEADPAMLLSLGVVRERAAADGTDARRRSLAQRLALAMLARRLERAADSAEAPLHSAEAFASHYVPARELILVRAAARPAEWKQAMSQVDYEVRRVNELGFHAAELEIAARREAAGTAAATRQAEQRTSAELTTALATSIARGVVFTSAADDHRLTEAQLASIDARECHAAFREMLWRGEWALAVVGPFGPDPAKQISIGFKESRTGEVVPYTPPAPPRPFPFTDFGPPGEIVTNDQAAAIDTQLVRFANGVRLNLKRTRFEPGQVRFELRLAGGFMACPPDKPGLHWRTFTWMFGGLRDYPLEELASLWAGRISSTEFNVSPAVFAFRARVDTDNVPLLFQVTTAFLVRPDLGGGAAARGLEIARQVVAPRASTAQGVNHWGMWQRMTGGHAAYRDVTMNEIGRHSLDDLKAWFDPLLASAPLEIGVIGDFDPAEVIDTCARTFGALPARANGDPIAGQRRTVFPPRPFSDAVSFEGTKGVAVITLGWPAPEAAEFPTQFRARIVSAILENRIAQKLRREMGETYAPAASLATENAFQPPINFLRCTVEAAPDRVERVAAVAREIAAALAREGASVDEFERARRPLMREVEIGLRSNHWWFDVVAVAQSNPGYGDDWARALLAYESATLEEINATARLLLSPERLCELIVRPK